MVGIFHGSTKHRTVRLVEQVGILSRAELARCPQWMSALAGERKDHRYYELLEDTVHPEFEYRYFAIKDNRGDVCAIQPFFILDQDFLVGIGPKMGWWVDTVRRVWPRLLKMRTLMVGCVAGEGHLDGDALSHGAHARMLASAIVAHARSLQVSLVVLKEFPAKYRLPLKCFVEHGFRRIPSLPMTRLNIDYPSFDEYMRRALNSATRTKLRRKFRATAQAAPITLSVITDVSAIIDVIYPLYLQVYQRSRFHFEKLTKEYFGGVGRAMPERVRFFLWRQEGRLVAFTLCMLHDDAMYAEYIGLDYSLALDLHLYHYAVRDMISWAMAKGYKWFRSSGLNYDPKLHLRHELDPVDLYVRHTSPIANAILKHVLPLIAPTRYDRTLKKFSNYDELLGER
jgi:predicted N-acyltransferase